MKKWVAILGLVSVLPGFVFAGGKAQGGSGGTGTVPTEITVISREDGSGTRGAFIELFKIEERDASGKRVDKTTKEAVISNRTDIMLSAVAGNPSAIGYVSLGSLNATVKAVNIDGTAASIANVENGSYKISRPFNIAVKGNAGGTGTSAAQDFISFILSREGQEVVAKGYIPVVANAPAYTGSSSGRVVLAGSSSVTPVMEQLREAYLARNPQAVIEIQMSDSSTGIKAAIDGTCDIGMASRELSDTEKAQLTPTVIAIDGIAVIINPGNPLSGLSSAQVKQVFTGEITSWQALN
ncbi:MAG: substrate-binding domain-containing protein [Spirochaetaceae bacterium]|jgi:phosphate transport system substrate-binding protein|nr:substrate-binding domain-containing protein [Spirochaetaceae bacterium]